MLTMAADGASDIGRVRERNEDAFVLDDDDHIYIVCDGMGGHNAGNVASAEACAEGRRFLRQRLTEFDADPPDPDAPPEREEMLSIVRASVQKACAHVYNMAQKDSAMAGMGTTMTASVFRGARGYVGHVGDSRLWLVRNGEAHPLTEDHRVVTELLKKGELTEEEAKDFPFPNSLSRSVGVQPMVEVDAIDFDVLEGDRILICSDGLHEYLTDEDIASLISGASTIEGMPDRLIELANSQGGSDNITALCLEIKEVRDSETQVSVDTLNMMEFIQRIPMFADLDFRELTSFLNHTKSMDYQAGDEVSAEGEGGTDLQVLLYGEVTVARSGKIVGTIGPGGPIGESSYLGLAPKGAAVNATEVTRTLHVNADELRETLQADPRLSAKLMTGLARALAQRLGACSGPTS